MNETEKAKEKEAALLKFAKKALVGHVQDMAQRCQILKQICLIYYVILAFIMGFALLKVFYPDLAAPILSREMGVIALACFVAIQISFELDDDTTNRPALARLKALFYILDLSIMINAKAPVVLTMISCVFSAIQLFFMYVTLSKEQARVKTDKSAEPKKITVAMSQTQISILIIAVNFLAISAGIATGIANLGIDSDAVLMIILGSLVMYYVQTLIKTKTGELLNKKEALEDLSVVELAFKVLKPVGAALFKDLRKFKFA